MCHDGQVRTVNEDDSSSAPVEGPPADINTYPDAVFSFGLEQRGSSVLDLARAGRKPERHLTRGRHTPRLTTCTRLQGALVVEEETVSLPPFGVVRIFRATARAPALAVSAVM